LRKIVATNAQTEPHSARAPRNRSRSWGKQAANTTLTMAPMTVPIMRNHPLRSEAPSCGWHTIAAEVPAQKGLSRRVPTGLVALGFFLLTLTPFNNPAGAEDSSPTHLIPGGWLQGPYAPVVKPLPVTASAPPESPAPEPATTLSGTRESLPWRPQATHRAAHHPQPPAPSAPTPDDKVRF
jgi:hypothetical protein